MNEKILEDQCPKCGYPGGAHSMRCEKNQKTAHGVKFEKDQYGVVRVRRQSSVFDTKTF